MEKITSNCEEIELFYKKFRKNVQELFTLDGTLLGN
jgi:hypothetical protein